MPFLNTIGVFSFLEMQLQVPTVSTQQLRVITREGVDGVFIMQTGFRPDGPFTLRTAIDAGNLVEALAFYNLYVLLIDSGPVGITWHGLPLSSGNQLYQVLKVRPIDIRYIGASVGGFNPPSLAICVCEWDLLPVVVTP